MREHPYWTKKREILLLRWLLIIAICYMLFFSIKEIEFFSTEFLFIYLFLISHIFLHFLKEKYFLRPYFNWVLVIFDTSFVFIFIYLTQSALIEIYLVFILIMILATLGENLKAIVGHTLIICTIYSLIILRSQILNAIYQSDIMLRIPFLFIYSIYYGSLVRKIKYKRKAIEQIETEKRETMAIYEVSNAISILLDTRKILQEVANHIDNLLANMDCQIILIGSDGLEGKIIGTDPEQEDKTISINEYPEIKEVLINQDILLVPNIMHEPLLLKVRKRFTSEGIKSIFLFPMAFQKEILGIIYIKNSEDNSSLPPHHIRLIKVIATTAANALKNAQLFEKVQLQASTDELTGLWNNRHFQQLFEIEVQRAQRKETALSMLFIDIDNLKMVNDLFGHPQGDGVIKEIANILKQTTRAIDVKARYAGDEFVCLLPDANPEQALKTAKRICKEVQKKFKATYNMISMSIGVATYPHIIKNPKDLLLFSDQAMYLTKYNGGNQARLASLEELQDMENWNKKALDAFISVMSKRRFQTGSEMVDRLSTKLKQALQQRHIDSAIIELVSALATAMDVKDNYTKRHSMEVREYSLIIADKLNLSSEEKKIVGLAALLHDIGKIGIPENILTKPGKLIPDEEEKMMSHPAIGAKILEPIKAFKDIIPLIKHHHENWDGTGYPSKLKGDQIPLGAQIISIVDVFHSLISNRSYRKNLSYSEAEKIIKEGAGKKWSQELTETFLETIKDYKDKIMKHEEDSSHNLT